MRIDDYGIYEYMRSKLVIALNYTITFLLPPFNDDFNRSTNLSFQLS